MKTKKQFTNRVLSLVLAFVMVISMLPMFSMTAFAAEPAEEVTVPIDNKTVTLKDSDSDGETAMTAEQFASGEVAYLLGSAWGQDLTTDGTYPILGDTPVTEKCDFFGQRLNFGADLSMKYYVEAYGTDFKAELLKVEFIFLGEKKEVSGEYDSTTGLYVFTLDGINPQCMGDNIYATLYYDGEEVVTHGYGEGNEYSIEKYLNNLLDDNSDDIALVTLIKDLLAYGEAASDYTGHQTMTGTNYAENGSDRELPDTSIVENNVFKGYTVVFGQQNYIKIKVNLGDNDKLYLNGEDVTAQLEKENTSDTYQVYRTAGIAATDFATVFEFKVHILGTPLMQTYSVSVNDYIGAKKDSETMGNLVKALYNYGVSAHLYDDTYEYEDGVCKHCGLVCTHVWKNGFCTACGAFEPATLNGDVYEISNAGQLMWFAQLVNNGETSANAILVADIDMDGIGTWSIMQTYDGTLDGNGYTIQGLNQNAGLGDGEQQGFIRRLTGTVKNTTFKNCSAFQQDSLGCAIIAYNNSGTISGCMVVGCNVQLGNYGGLALVTGGNLSDGVIENCGVVGGNITRRFSGINNQGMAAITEQNGGTVQNCFAYGFNLNNNDSKLGALVYSGNAPVNSYYYYSGDKVFDSAVESIAKTAEQFASGEVAYLLQQGNTEQVWGQDNNQTGAKPMFTSNELYKVVTVGETGNYSVANVGDTNADGTVDVNDYQALVNKALADDHEQIETAEYDDIVRYDLDGDGYLDVLDVSLMERMINGHKTADVYAVGDYDLNGKAFEEADILAMAEAMKNPEDLATYQKYACDLNADGKVTEADLTALTSMFPLYFADEK